MVERPSRWPVFQGWSNGVINLDFFFSLFTSSSLSLGRSSLLLLPLRLFHSRPTLPLWCCVLWAFAQRFAIFVDFFIRLISLNWYYYVEIGISRRKRWSVTINLTIDIGYNFNQTKQTCSTWLVTTIMSNKIVRNFIESLHIFVSLQSGDWMKRKLDTFYCGFYFKP